MIKYDKVLTIISDMWSKIGNYYKIIKANSWHKFFFQFRFEWIERIRFFNCSHFEVQKAAVLAAYGREDHEYVGKIKCVYKLSDNKYLVQMHEVKPVTCIGLHMYIIT